MYYSKVIINNFNSRGRRNIYIYNNTRYFISSFKRSKIKGAIMGRRRRRVVGLLCLLIIYYLIMMNAL